MIQLSLSFQRALRVDAPTSCAALALPWHKIRIAARRHARKLSSSVPSAALLKIASMAERQALLDALRQAARREASILAGGRPSKRAIFAYACKPEGRRVAHAIAALSEQLAQEEARLCG